MEREPLIKPSINHDPDTYNKWRCYDCKQLFIRDQIANIITPRCWSCHYTLLFNVTLTSCNIMYYVVLCSIM